MKNSKENIWHSGDWKSKHNENPPYNGLQIKATANYDKPTVPPTTQKFKDVKLEIIDFTHDKDGVSSKVELKKTGVWCDITLPKIGKTALADPNPHFTVVGIYNDTLGKVKLDHNSDGIYLSIQFRYGIGSVKREEIGYVMKFDSIYNKNHDPIETYDPIDVED